MASGVWPEEPTMGPAHGGSTRRGRIRGKQCVEHLARRESIAATAGNGGKGCSARWKAGVWVVEQRAAGGG